MEEDGVELTPWLVRFTELKIQKFFRRRAQEMRTSVGLNREEEEEVERRKT